MTGRPQGPAISRDCTHQRHHAHGTPGRYKYDRCRCTPCRNANATVMANRRRLTAYGRWAPWGSAVGVRRRLQALSYNGFSAPALAAEMGTTEAHIRRLRDETDVRITAATHQRVARLYDALWSAAPPRTAATVKVQNRARRLGYVPPLGWDDDDSIDDPAAVPQHDLRGGPWELQPCGTRAAARRHHRNGEKPCDACSNAERRRNTERAA